MSVAFSRRCQRAVRTISQSRLLKFSHPGVAASVACRFLSWAVISDLLTYSDDRSRKIASALLFLLRWERKMPWHNEQHQKCEYAERCHDQEQMVGGEVY